MSGCSLREIEVKDHTVSEILRLFLLKMEDKMIRKVKYTSTIKLVLHLNILPIHVHVYYVYWFNLLVGYVCIILCIISLTQDMQ